VSNPLAHPVDVELLPDGRRFRLLSEDFYVTNAGETIVVPAGYITDFASIPRFLWWLLPPTGRYQYAALIHDRLYDLHNRKRIECDRILAEVMKRSGVPAWQRFAIYWGVRIGGGSHWKGR
jgi:hypothetical protein